MRCPFSAPLTSAKAACHQAHEVVRRGGTEIDCRSETAHAVCSEVFARLKDRGLQAFGVEDDLTLMPHSVLVKIQTGGLLGIRRLLGDPDAVAALSGTAAAFGAARSWSATAERLRTLYETLLHRP